MLKFTALLCSAQMPTQTPTLIWAQRLEKVFVTFDQLSCKDVTVQFSEGLLSLEATSGEKHFKLDNMPLWAEIDCEESKWFVNDRRATLCSHSAGCPCSRSVRGGRIALVLPRAGMWSSR